jgi:hypothetical protein
MIIKIIRKVEHITNPLHIMCKFDKVLMEYDKIWVKIFNQRGHLSSMEIIREHIRNKKTSRD